jgi:hypothetical protein
MIPLPAALLLLFDLSPADSCARALTLADIPPEAILYAELAAREGGEGALLLGRLLELSGSFESAGGYYRIALTGAVAPGTADWLEDRILGCTPIDTLMVLRATIRNTGSETAGDLTLVMPRPQPHPPFQQIDILGGAFSVDSTVLVCRIDSLAPGESRQYPVFLHIVQRPGTFRPIRMPDGLPSVAELGELLRSIEVPSNWTGRGPCLDMAESFRELAEARGIDASVTGGIVRRGDSLIFHAWNTLESGIPGLPLDPLLFRTDSLRAVGHCPVDVIPLWSLERGYELSVIFPSYQSGIEIELEAMFSPLDPVSIEVPALLDIPRNGGAGRRWRPVRPGSGRTQ